MYALTSLDGLHKSEDAGATWSPIMDVTVYEMAFFGDTIYAATFDGLQRSVDRGRNWEIVLLSTALSVGVDPASHALIAGGRGGQVYWSTDQATTWSVTPFSVSLMPQGHDGSVRLTRVSGPLRTHQANFLDHYVDIDGSGSVDALSPSDAVSGGGGLYAVSGGAVYWRDGSTNWTLVGTSPFFTAGAIDYLQASTEMVVVGGFSGVALSQDGGISWEVLQSAGAPSSFDEVMLWNSNPPFVVASDGAEIWAWQISTSNVSKDAPDLPDAAFHLLAPYPNPATDWVTVPIVQPEASTLDVRVYDMAGREVHTAFDGLMHAGEYKLRLRTEGWASGTYIVRAGDQSQAFTVVR